MEHVKKTLFNKFVEEGSSKLISNLTNMSNLRRISGSEETFEQVLNLLEQQSFELGLNTTTNIQAINDYLIANQFFPETEIEAIATNKTYTIEAFKTIFKELEYDTLTKFAKYSQNETVIDYIAEKMNTSNKHLETLFSAMARNPYTSNGTLNELATFPAVKVRLNVLNNPNTSIDTLVKMAKTDSYEPIIDQLAQDEEAMIRYAVAENSKLPEMKDVLVTIAYQDDDELKQILNENKVIRDLGLMTPKTFHRLDNAVVQEARFTLFVDAYAPELNELMSTYAIPVESHIEAAKFIQKEVQEFALWNNLGLVDVEYKSMHALCNAEFNLVDFELEGDPEFTEEIIDNFNVVINELKSMLLETFKGIQSVEEAESLTDLAKQLEDSEYSIFDSENKPYYDIMLKCNKIVSKILLEEGVISDERLDQLSGSYKLDVLHNYCVYNDEFFETYHTKSGECLEIHTINLDDNEFYVFFDESCGECAEIHLFATREKVDKFLKTKDPLEVYQDQLIEEFKGLLADDVRPYVDVFVSADSDDLLNYSFDISLRNENNRVDEIYLKQPNLTPELVLVIEKAVEKLLNNSKATNDIMDFCNVTMEDVKSFNQNQER